jgi:hypothetical protein
MAFVSTLLHPFVTISCPTRLRWRRGEPCSIGLAVASAHILLACHNREETECRSVGNSEKPEAQTNLRRKTTRISRKVTKLPSLKISQVTSRSACNASKKGIKTNLPQTKTSSQSSLQPSSCGGVYLSLAVQVLSKSEWVVFLCARVCNKEPE